MATELKYLKFAEIGSLFVDRFNLQENQIDSLIKSLKDDRMNDKQSYSYNPKADIESYMVNQDDIRRYLSSRKYVEDYEKNSNTPHPLRETRKIILEKYGIDMDEIRENIKKEREER